MSHAQPHEKAPDGVPAHRQTHTHADAYGERRDIT